MCASVVVFVVVDDDDDDGAPPRSVGDMASPRNAKTRVMSSSPTARTASANGASAVDLDARAPSAVGSSALVRDSSSDASSAAASDRRRGADGDGDGDGDVVAARGARAATRAGRKSVITRSHA
jgi:hypothetical protein